MKYIIPSLLLIFVLFSGILTCSSQESKPIVTFGIVTDVHYADMPDKDAKSYNQSLDKLEDCVHNMNVHAVDFLIELGDFKDIDASNSEEKSMIYLYRAEKVFSKFIGPKYHVLGNHDVDCISKTQFLSVATNTGIPPVRTYYSYNFKGIHFVVLDANYDSAGIDFEKGKFSWNDPNIPDHELKWLKKDLHKTKYPTVVFIHQPLDGSGEYFVNNSDVVRRILEKSGKVTAVFQGHYHAGNYRLLNGIHYYTLKALVEGSGMDNSSFAIVSVYPDIIKVKGFKRAESLQFGYQKGR
jgi:hypothetical protein